MSWLGKRMALIDDDIVIHLGDFCLGSIKKAAYYMSQLNGNVWILDNYWHHDKNWLKKATTMHTKTGLVELLNPLMVFSIRHDKITCCHYPMLSWEASYYGTVMVHGHTHSPVFEGAIANSFNVCVEATNYTPVNITQFLIKE